MLILFGLLFAALYPTTVSHWTCLMLIGIDTDCGGPLQYPARCFWSRNDYGAKYENGCISKNTTSTDGMLSYIFLVANYSWKAAMLFSPARQRLETLVRTTLLRRLEMQIKRLAPKQTRRRWNASYRLLLTIYFPLFAVMEFVGSFAGALWAVSIGLTWGTLQLTLPRNGMDSITSNGVRQEKVWDFGQVLPVLLLIYPLIAFCTQFTAEDVDRHIESSQCHHVQLPGPCAAVSTGPNGGQTSRCTKARSQQLHTRATSSYNGDNADETMRASAVSTMFIALNTDDNSTFEGLHSAIYHTKTFKAVLIVLNCHIGAGVILTFTMTALVPGQIYLFLGSGIVACIFWLWLISACTMCCSRLYR